jgi:hypothetical protein
MALTTALGLFVMSVLTAAFSRLLAEEIGDWSQWIIRSLIKTAAAILPEKQRERYVEEWQSHVNEVPGRIGKFCSAASLLTAAYKMARTDELSRLVEGWQQTLMQLQETDAQAILAMDVIEADEDLTSQEKLMSTVARLRLLMPMSTEEHTKLATIAARTASAAPSTLAAKLSHRRHIKRLSKEFDQLARMVQEKAEGVELIGMELRKRKERLKAAGSQ